MIGEHYSGTLADFLTVFEKAIAADVSQLEWESKGAAVNYKITVTWERVEAEEEEDSDPEEMPQPGKPTMNLLEDTAYCG